MAWSLARRAATLAHSPLFSRLLFAIACALSVALLTIGGPVGSALHRLVGFSESPRPTPSLPRVPVAEVATWLCLGNTNPHHHGRSLSAIAQTSLTGDAVHIASGCLCLVGCMAVTTIANSNQTILIISQLTSEHPTGCRRSWMAPACGPRASRSCRGTRTSRRSTRGCSRASRRCGCRR